MLDLVDWIVRRIVASPILALLVVAAPFMVLAWWKRIYPGRTAVMLMAVPCLLTSLLFWKTDILPLVASVDVALVVLALIDLANLPGREQIGAERDVIRIASLGKKQPVCLTITNRSSRDQLVSVRDDIPDGFSADETFERIALPAKSRVLLHYSLDCPRRGDYRMSKIYVCAHSRFGFWQRYLQHSCDNGLHVYPDMQQLSKYALLARTNRLSLMGVRRQRRVGQDNEFERLRDFTRDDHFKHMDWRATARRNKLTVRDFQTNQSQRVVFMLDCGRMMVNQAAGVSLLDHALNAMLMLSYVALRQGDAVGMLAFSDKIHAYVPPKGGAQYMSRLLHASFDRFPSLVESRYDQAFLHLSRRCRKRSLLVLITNIVDEVNASQIQSYLGTTAAQHLPLCVVLRDHRLFDVAESALETDQQLYDAAAAAGILNWRRQVLNQLQHQGVLVVDEYPDKLTAPLVNRYLDVKARHLL